MINKDFNYEYHYAWVRWKHGGDVGIVEVRKDLEDGHMSYEVPGSDNVFRLGKHFDILEYIEDYDDQSD